MKARSLFARVRHTVFILFCTTPLLAQQSFPFNENFDTYAGSGLAPAPSPGQLDSDDWRVSGLSDGSSTFGGSFTSGDFARGTSSGKVGTGGLYAFDTGGNLICGVQPTGTDFTPGDFTLRLVNNTGSRVTDLQVSYTIWYYNDQARSSKLDFAYSTDDVTYSPIPALDFTTPVAADASPAWQAVSRSTVLTGLNLNPGDFIYLKWRGDDDTGKGSRDEYGIDDITVTALAPEIDVQGNGMSIADGDTTPSFGDSTDFGGIDLGSALDRTFVIANTGTSDLILTSSPPVLISGANAGDFSVISQPSSPIAPGNTATVKIRFSPGAAGLRQATVTIENNDTDENPFDFAIQGTGINNLPLNFTLHAEQRIVIEKPNHSSGAIHANGDVFFLEGNTPVSIHTGMVSAYGDIDVGTRNAIIGRAIARGQVRNAGRVTEGTVSGAPVPYVALPGIPNFTPGTTDIRVGHGERLPLPPGSYRDVGLAEGAVLALQAGTYDLRNLQAASKVTLIFDVSQGPIVVHIEDIFQLGNGVRYRLFPESGETAAVHFGCKSSGTIRFGAGSSILGTLVAPFAIVEIGASAQYQGEIAAREIRCSAGSRFVSHKTAPTVTKFSAPAPVEQVELPNGYSLSQNYPNPFNPSTSIRFGLAEASEVQLAIYNTRGQLIRLLANGFYPSGHYQVIWDGRNGAGVRVASGMYFYRIQAGPFQAQRKLLLLR